MPMTEVLAEGWLVGLDHVAKPAGALPQDPRPKSPIGLARRLHLPGADVVSHAGCKSTRCAGAPHEPARIHSMPRSEVPVESDIWRTTTSDMMTESARSFPRVRIMDEDED